MESYNRVVVLPKAPGSFPVCFIPFAATVKNLVESDSIRLSPWTSRCCCETKVDLGWDAATNVGIGARKQTCKRRKVGAQVTLSLRCCTPEDVRRESDERGDSQFHAAKWMNLMSAHMFTEERDSFGKGKQDREHDGRVGPGSDAEENRGSNAKIYSEDWKQREGGQGSDRAGR